jgi:hypothetical protein
MKHNAKLDDPANVAELHQRREVLQRQAKVDAMSNAERAQYYTLRVAIHTCLAAREDLTQPELGLVRSCRELLKAVVPLTAGQQKWLLDIAQRTNGEVAEDIDRLVHKWANGNADGEHPTYPREKWPLAGVKGLKPTAYWHWALSELVRNGGEEEHCDECGAQLDDEGWDGLCGNCADRVESGEVTREQLAM